MAHRVHVFFRELNAINKDKHDEEKCKRIIDEGGMELVHCICDCVHNILQDNIPFNEEEKESLRIHKELLRKLVNEKTSDRERERIIQDGGFLGPNIPILVGLVGKLFTGQWLMKWSRNPRWPNEERNRRPNIRSSSWYWMRRKLHPRQLTFNRTLK